MEPTFDLKDIEEKLIANLKNVFDPEIPTNIYDLGLIYNVEFDINSNYLYCTITMTLTSPTCPVISLMTCLSLLYNNERGLFHWLFLKIINKQPPRINTIPGR